MATDERAPDRARPARAPGPSGSGPGVPHDGDAADDADAGPTRRHRFARVGRVLPVAVVQIGGTVLLSNLGRTTGGGWRGPGPWNGAANTPAVDPIALTPVAIVLLVAGVVALPLRFRAPVVVLGITLATTIGYALVVSPRGPFVAALTMALVNAVFRMRRRDAMVAAGIAIVVLPWADVLTGRSSVLPWGTTTFALAWATATIAIAELARIRSVRAAEARQARAEADRRRAGEERVRIARELHDSVAHNMSLINLQAGVALHLGADLPAATRESLTNIRDASRDALVELRTVLGVLRGVDEERTASDGVSPSGTDVAPRSERSPVPGIDRLPELVERARAAGLPVSLELVGDPASIGPVVDRSAFRIVQESVTNVMKHAPGNTAAVRVVIGAEVVDIEVLDSTALGPTPLDPTVHVAPRTTGVGAHGTVGRDPGIGATSPAPSGNGLIGMRERATAAGGTFSAGPVPEGGWRVRARLPRGEAAHAERTGGMTDA